MTKELIIAFVFLILLFLMVNPGEIAWMPSMAETAAVSALVVMYALYAVFFWREESRDEREDLHRLLAGRIAFFVGASILVLGIAYQAYHYKLDPWLPLALGSMILAKAITRIWGSLRK